MKRAKLRQGAAVSALLLVVAGPWAAMVASPAPLSARKVAVVLVDITDGTSHHNAIDSGCDANDVVAKTVFGYQANDSVDYIFGTSSFANLGIGGATYPGLP